MVYEWLWYLAEPSLPQFHLASGQAYELTLPNRPVIDQATLTGPMGETAPLTMAGDAEGQRVVRVTDTVVPGDYRVELSREGKSVSVHPFQVERDVAESDLAPLEDEMIERLRSQAHMLFDEETSQAVSEDAIPGERRQEPLWFWLLMGVVLFLVGESALACSIAKSRTLTRPGETLT